MSDRWTDIVSAYEADLAVLEEGRRAYDAACRDIIHGLHAAIDKRLPALAAETGLQLELAFSDSEQLGQYITRVEVTTENSDWFSVAAWVASSFEGPVKTLRVAVYVLADADALGEPTEAFITRFRTHESWTEPPPVDVTDDAVAHTAIDLANPRAIELALEEIVRRVRKLQPTVGVLDTRAEPVVRAKRALLEVRDRLLGKKLHTRQSVSPKGKSLSTQRGSGLLHVWLEHPRPSIWLGVDPRDGSLWYLHDRDDDDSRLPTVFAKRVRAKAGELDDYRGGIIMSAKTLLSMEHDEIVERCFEVLNEWIAYGKENGNFDRWLRAKNASK